MTGRTPLQVSSWVSICQHASIVSRYGKESIVIRRSWCEAVHWMVLVLGVLGHLERSYWVTLVIVLWTISHGCRHSLWYWGPADGRKKQSHI